MATIVRAPARQRVHVNGARFWSLEVGTDYWAQFGIKSTIASANNSIEVLSDYGWTTTALTETVSSGDGDFFNITDDISVPAHVLTDNSGDLLQSPSMFGDGAGSEAAASILGYTPTTLSCVFYGAMTVFSGTSNRSGWGLTEVGGTAGVSADELAWIFTDGTNFTIRSDTDSDAGAADDADYHTWKIVISSGSVTDAVEWFIDGSSQGTMDRKTDEWPVSFGMHAFTTNRPSLAWVHIFYT